jgi:hypothetical protein
MIRLVPLVLAAVAITRTASAADFEGRAEYRITGSQDQRGSAVALVGPGGVRFQMELTSERMSP